MNLLRMKCGPEFQKLADEIYSRQMQDDPRIKEELNTAAREKMYQDVLYNVNLIYTALELNHDSIFEDYARWLYQLLCSLMTYCTRERVRDYMLTHYSLIKECMVKVIPNEKQPDLIRMMDAAMEATIKECRDYVENRVWRPGKYEKEAREYLKCLLEADTKKAIFLISEYVKKGIPLTTVYVEIIAKAMQEVGELWHSHSITVAKEHYCTSVTQMAMAQMYPAIFKQERRGTRMLAACVGDELHEMGIRMVADLFEYNGWDSFYLGAGVPIREIEAAVEDYQPDLVALSVTMPEHLLDCREAVRLIRSRHQEIKIAVGGRAFENTDEMWKKWNADVYAPDVRDLVAWAEQIR